MFQGLLPPSKLRPVPEMSPQGRIGKRNPHVASNQRGDKQSSSSSQSSLLDDVSGTVQTSHLIANRSGPSGDFVTLMNANIAINALKESSESAITKHKQALGKIYRLEKRRCSRNSSLKKSLNTLHDKQESCQSLLVSMDEGCGESINNLQSNLSAIEACLGAELPKLRNHITESSNTSHSILGSRWAELEEKLDILVQAQQSCEESLTTIRDFILASHDNIALKLDYLLNLQKGHIGTIPATILREQDSPTGNEHLDNSDPPANVTHFIGLPCLQTPTQAKMKSSLWNTLSDEEDDEKEAVKDHGDDIVNEQGKSKEPSLADQTAALEELYAFLYPSHLSRNLKLTSLVTRDSPSLESKSLTSFVVVPLLAATVAFIFGGISARLWV